MYGKYNDSDVIITSGKGKKQMIKENEPIIEKQAPEEKPRFVIDSDAKALWAIDKIRATNRRRDELLDFYKEQIEKAKEEADDENAYLSAMLESYFATVPHKVTATQESYSLPGAKLIRKRQNEDYTRDDKKVVEWLQANGMTEYVNVKYELNWNKLKKDTATSGASRVTADGEVIPGIEVTARPDKFVIEV